MLATTFYKFDRSWASVGLEYDYCSRFGLRTEVSDTILAKVLPFSLVQATFVIVWVTSAIRTFSELLLVGLRKATVSFTILSF